MLTRVLRPSGTPLRAADSSLGRPSQGNLAIAITWIALLAVAGVDVVVILVASMLMTSVGYGANHSLPSFGTDGLVSFWQVFAAAPSTSFLLLLPSSLCICICRNFFNCLAANLLLSAVGE